MVRSRQTDFALSPDAEDFVLFREQARLIGGCGRCCGLAARNSHDTEHGDFRERTTRHKNAIG